MHCERAHSPQKALQIFHDELNLLNLRCQLSIFGTDPRTTKCFLLNSEGNIADIGNGKGIGLQSEISAKYEALEHYLSTQKSFLKNECLSFSLKEIEHRLSDVNKIALPMYYIKKCREKRTPWISMRAFIGDTSCMFPYFLIDPDYRKQPFPHDELDYMSWSEMPTNNGTAIGATFEEAMLHAINELVERDALSCFLLSTFCKEAPSRTKLVQKGTLPDRISQIINKIEKAYEEELLIVDISNDLKCPVFLASFTKQNQLIQPMGTGASLNPEYALERAILEALQSLHLTDEKIKSEDTLILKRFNQWPRLKKCAQCDLKSLSNIEIVGCNQSENSSYKLNESLDLISKILENNNLQIFYAKHYESPSGITCLKVVIPELEQFHRVRYGRFAFPGTRGRALLSNQEIPIVI